MPEDRSISERTGDDQRRVRAGDADRDRAVAQLRTHHEEGRLDASEFEERMSAALGARYCDELPPLLADLPSDQRAPGHEQMPPSAHRRGRGPVWAHPLLGMPLLPVLAVLAVLAILASLGAVTHGHFPVPLLVGALLLWAWRGRLRAAHQGTGGAHAPAENVADRSGAGNRSAAGSL